MSLHSHAWAVACCMAFAAQPAMAACRGASGDSRLPVVELYTAEGCNECPAADRWLSWLAQRQDHPALLALHVDYWDGIGWPDRFAAALHGKRQEARVVLSGKRVAYTPQVMIGQYTNVEWRDGRQVAERLREARATPPGADLALTVARQGAGLQLEFTGTARNTDVVQSQPLLWLALYQDGLASEVKAGENKGLTLRHDRVVRALHGPWRWEGKILAGKASIPVPDEEGPLGLVLFAESSLTGAGLQALDLPLSACLPGQAGR
ncbi:DUF1223 domain-containing protein [Pseudoxanthomonas wuyuanensis]